MNELPVTKILTYIHLALLTGLLGIAAFVFWEQQRFDAIVDTEDIFLYIVPMFAVSGYFLSHVLVQNILGSINNNTPLQEKLGKYRNATFLKYALIEAAALLGLIAYYLKGNALYLVIALFMILYLITQRPTEQKLISDLSLSEKERREI